MRVILEELEGDVARLIPDNGSDPIEISRWKLPNEVVLGDVFEIYYESNRPSIIEKIHLIPNERNRRLEKVKTKREILIKRTKGKKISGEETKG